MGGRKRLDRWIAATALLGLCLHTSSAVLARTSLGKVKVDFYGEALCPFCAKFTLTVVDTLIANKVMDAADFSYIPYGNAHFNQDSGELQCQHGPRECQLNKLLGCAIELHPTLNAWFPFVKCVERGEFDGRHRRLFAGSSIDDVAHSCAKEAQLDASQILDCYSGQRGEDLQQLARNKTDALRPPHQWVPWLVVNGVPLFDDMDNLQLFICAAAEPEQRAPACYEPPPPVPGNFLLSQRLLWPWGRSSSSQREQA